MAAAQLKSMVENPHNHAQSLVSQRPEDDSTVRKLHKAKQAVWLFLLTCMFLFYYLLDKLSEALALL